MGVAWAGSPQSYESFINKHGLTFINIDDSDGDIYSHFGITGQPAWAFISQSGEAQLAFRVLSEKELDEQIDKLRARK